MVPVGLLLHMITLFLWSMSTTSTFVSASKTVPITKRPDCSSQCGRVEIPYPFGIELGCYLDHEWFQMFCDKTNIDGTGNPTLFLSPAKLNLEVFNISIEGTIQVRNNFTWLDPAGCDDLPGTSRQPVNLSGSPFVYSRKNIFTAVACGGFTRMTLSNGSGIGTIGGCQSTCHPENMTTYGSCTNGINCCERQAIIPPELTAFNYSFESKDNKTAHCKYAFLNDPDWDISFWDISPPVAVTPVLLD